jgi:hypothetical protein
LLLAALIEINEQILEKPPGFIESAIAPGNRSTGCCTSNQDEADGTVEQLGL